MRTMPRILLLLFCMSVVTMVFIARCGISIDSQLENASGAGLPTSGPKSPGEKALREVMRRKEVEHSRDRSALQEKIKSLENQLLKVKNGVGNITSDLKPPENEGMRNIQWLQNKNQMEQFSQDFQPQYGRRVRVKPVGEEGWSEIGVELPGRPRDRRRSRHNLPLENAFQMQRRLIRGQSDDYPLLDARMSQDFYPSNRNDQNKEVEFQNGGNMNNGFQNPQRGMDTGQTLQDPSYANTVTANYTDYKSYIKERLKSAEILSGITYKTEYELIPFNRFVFNRIFQVDPGLGKRVVGKPIGSRKKDMSEILAHAINSLNGNRTSNRVMYSHEDFIEGLYRVDPSVGTQYELIFKNKDEKYDGLIRNSQHSYIKMSIVRPFSPPLTLFKESVNTEDSWINIILPLSGRLDTFRIFLNQFINVCIQQDKRIYLTVVYFGTEGLREVKTMMGRVAKANKFKHMKLITLNEMFTRGRALQIGALNWKHGDVLLFFCDVDIVFTAEFLERCRLNTARGERVYYPIVFSLYNPNIVYSLQDAAIPPFHDQLVLSKDTGFWRDFGYGMTCQFRSDFLKIKGFDEQITGWGGEDVFLYQKFVRSDYFVIRATDPGIFHLWHEKYCEPNLSAEQYRSCIRSKALNEASHPQLGLLAFKDEINVHRSVSERNSLLAARPVSARAAIRRKNGMNTADGIFRRR